MSRRERRYHSLWVRVDQRRSLDDVADHVFYGYRPSADRQAPAKADDHARSRSPSQASVSERRSLDRELP